MTRVISRFLYTPLSVAGMRSANSRKSAKYHLLAIWIPLLVNFEAIALWHGAALTFVVFGLLHAVWFIAEVEITQTSIWKKFKKKTSKPTRAALGRAFFIVPMVLCFSLFRSDSLESWVNLSASMFQPELTLAKPRELLNFIIVIGALAFCLLLPNAYELTRSHDPGIRAYQNPSAASIASGVAWRPTMRWGLFCAVAMLCVIYYIGRLPPFLYLGF